MYWTVAKFGRMLNLASYWGMERSNGAWMQLEAIERLQALAAKQGNREVGDLLTFQSEQLRQLQNLQIRQPRTLDWMTILSWNAAVGQAASLALMICGVVLLAAGVPWLIGRLRPTTATIGMRWAIQAGGALSSGRLRALVSGPLLELPAIR